MYAPRVLRCLGLVALVAACGDGVRVDADASVPVDGSARLVTLQLTDRVGGLPVYFQHEDSTVALATMTDDAGRASAYMTRPGFVTVVSADLRITTYAGVEPGDDILVGQAFVAPGPQVPLNVRVPSFPAMGYQVLSSCGESEVNRVPTTFVMRVERCADTMDAMLVSFDLDESNNPIPGPRYYQLLRDVPIVALSTVAFGETYEREVPGAVTVNGLPPGTNDLRVQQRLVADRRIVALAESWPTTTTPTARNELGAIPRTPDVVVQTSVEVWTFGPLSTPHLIEWGPGSTELTVELDPLPRAYTEPPRFVPETNTVTWAEEPSGDVANVAIARLRWSTSNTSPSWTIVSPRGDEPFVQLPVLPDPALRPVAPTTFVDGLDSLVYPYGYRAFRDLGHVELTSVVPTLTPAGRIAYRSLRQ